MNDFDVLSLIADAVKRMIDCQEMYNLDIAILLRLTTNEQISFTNRQQQAKPLN